MRTYLRSLGYRVHDWGLGQNLGARSIGAEGERLDQLVDDLNDGGSKKISLVGHSLGGVMARAFAVRRPQAVRQVICLGSPFVEDSGGVNQTVLRLHERLTGEGATPDTATRPPPPQVPMTAIYSRSDGIVSPGVCTEAESKHAQ